MEIPEELKIFVSDLEEYSDEVIKALYEVAFNLYPDESCKIIRYYYFGFLLTSDDFTFTATKMEVSNVKIEKAEGKESNPYWLRYKSLLAAFGLDGDDGNTVEVIAY